MKSIDTHFINVGTRETFRPTGDWSSTPESVDNIVGQLGSSGRDVVIHFHGGLVREAAGYETAQKMTDVYLEAGLYPITFVWETGFGETVLRNLDTISQTKLVRKLLNIVVRRAMRYRTHSFNYLLPR